MRGIYYNGQDAVYREDLPMPTPRQGESLIRILATAICNTDREVRIGYRPDFRGIMGHEFVGRVEQSDDEKLIGKKVVGEINVPCKKCIYCKSGRYTHCVERQVLGMSRDGCFAEYMVLRNDLLYVIDDAVSTEDAVYTEPMAAACEILTQVSAEDKNIAVIGDGRLAYCIAQVFHAMGHELTVIGRHPEKLELFHGIANTTMEKELEHYEIVIEATGSPEGIREALKLVRKKGTIVLKSTYKGETSLPMTEVAVNEITITGSRCGPFAPVVTLLNEGKIRALPEIGWYDCKDFEEAFDAKIFKAGFRF